MDPTTQALAQKLGIQPQSIRARLCRTGSYFGVRPTKAPNGRLLWPPNAYAKIVSKASVIADAESTAPSPANQDVDVIGSHILEQLSQHSLEPRAERVVTEAADTTHKKPILVEGQGPGSPTRRCGPVQHQAALQTRKGTDT